MKTALISVSDKTGLIPFAKGLVAKGVTLISTGGTSKQLREAGVPVTEIGDFTGFPEVMDGRVRTLHPKVHTALLARQGNAEDNKVLKNLGVPTIDLVVVNLYPFEAALKKRLPDDELIEQIDIGGPTMLRAAAKNYERVFVVVDPADYDHILSLDTQAPEALSFRRELASKVFAHTAYYDSLISEQFLKVTKPQTWSAAGRLVSELRYGENPQQQASWWSAAGAADGLHAAQILQGKALSYNNILDLQAAVRLVRRFSQPAAIVVKHNNPCGVAFAESVDQAVRRAIDADPVSAFGGIVAVNTPINQAAAESLSTLFLECVIAPHISPEAANVFLAKKNLRVLQWPTLAQFQSSQEVRSVDGGYLLQSCDTVASDWSNEWRVIGKAPTEVIKQDILLAWKTVASLKSNAIAIAEGGQTLGLGMGQVNRVDAVKQALERAKRFSERLPTSVLASDAFFPFPDSVESLAQAGIRYVIQPGGSVKDADVLAAAERLQVTMILTGVRHFMH
jgi:phosphoribosylaminoimidazolecarboxamide formyltransferase/IMP cyclohydrolase